MRYVRSALYVRDVAVATLVIVGLYGLAEGIQFQPFQIPGYLLIVGFDMLETGFGSFGTNYDVLFATYLLGVGMVGGTVAHLFRKQVRNAGLPSWRFGVAGALVVVGILSLSFALIVFLGAGLVVPALITGATALVMLTLAGWVTGLLTQFFDSLSS